MPQLGQRQFEGGGQMRVRLVAALESRQKFAQRDMRAPGVVEREARLEIGLRLAPQLLPLAEDAQRIQEHRVLVVLSQPAFGLFQLSRRLGGTAFGVEQRELRIPIALETARKNFGRFAVAARAEEGARPRQGDLRNALIGIRQP